MRRLFGIVVMMLSSAAADYLFSFLSMAVDALPPAQYAKWVALLEGASSNRLQFQVVNAAMQWYAGPVMVGLATSVVATIAGGLGMDWSSILLGAAAFAVANGALGGRFDVVSIFSVFFAVVCAAGGWAIGDRIVRRRINVASAPLISRA
jgi:hypothetical protein